MEYSRPPPELEVLSADEMEEEEGNVGTLDESWAAHDEVYNRLLMPPSPERRVDDGDDDDYDEDNAEEGRSLVSPIAHAFEYDR